MAEMSDYLEAALINAVLRNTTYTSPVTFYLSLHTADPTDVGDGAEVSGSGYARQAIAFDAPGATDGETENVDLESFTASGGDWGTITHIAIWDAVTVGNMLFHTPLDSSRVVNDGDTLEVAAGALTVTLA